MPRRTIIGFNRFFKERYRLSIIGITAPPILIPTIQFVLYINKGIFEKLIPTDSSMIPDPSKNDTKTMIIASRDEKPMSLNAFVTMRYTKYNTSTGRRMTKR
jgi:hypothetical protein